jgi:hypothetical protein
MRWVGWYTPYINVLRDPETREAKAQPGLPYLTVYSRLSRVRPYYSRGTGPRAGLSCSFWDQAPEPPDARVRARALSPNALRNKQAHRPTGQESHRHYGRFSPFGALATDASELGLLCSGDSQEKQLSTVLLPYHLTSRADMRAMQADKTCPDLLPGGHIALQ